MRLFWLRRLVVWSALGALCFGGAPALANGHLGRAFGYSPTGYVEFAPTAYYMPTAYYVPSVYATSYTWAPTDFFVPTVYSAAAPLPVYATTSFLLPTTYLAPDPYFVPTAYVDVVATSMDCSPCGVPTVVMAADPCATAPAPRRLVTPAPTPAAPSKGSKPSGGAAAKTPPASLDSIPANEPATASRPESSAVPEPPSNRQPAPLVDTSLPSPPIAPVPEKEAPPTPVTPPPAPVTPLPAPVTPPPPVTSSSAKPPAATPPAIPAAPAQPKPAPPIVPTPAGINSPAVKPPVAPGGDQLLPPIEPAPPGEADTVRRQSQKPVLSAISRSPQPYQHAMTRGRLTALQGKVVSGDGNAPEDGVQITLSNRVGTFTDRVVTTDSQGRYGVWLPEGDWTVKVSTRSGRVFVVSQLTVTAGQITDDQGRDIPSLTITR
jgi:hypothetical protein